MPTVHVMNMKGPIQTGPSSPFLEFTKIICFQLFSGPSHDLAGPLSIWWSVILNNSGSDTEFGTSAPTSVVLFYDPQSNVMGHPQGEGL